MRTLSLFIKFLVLACLLGVSHEAIANNHNVNLRGIVVDSESMNGISPVLLEIKQIKLQSFNKEDGTFSISLRNGVYSLVVSCLGYKTQEVVVVADSANDQHIEVRLQRHSLALDEVVVTAKEGENLVTSSIVGRAALDHLQSSSLTDVMQLVPGALTTNSDLSKRGKITIRSIDSDDITSSLGTAILIDNARIENDANLQMSAPRELMKLGTSSGTGIDTRQITVDQIESIEVVRGIASVEHGDMTSGVVLLKTKAGYTPWQLRAMMLPNSKQFSLGKGFVLPNKESFINLGLDYAKSFEDLRTPARAYERATFQLGYSTLVKGVETELSFNIKGRFHLTRDAQEKDKDQYEEEEYRSQDQLYYLNFYGNWRLNKSWISNLRYAFSGSYGKQFDQEKVWISGNRKVITDFEETGLHVASLFPHQYYSDFRVEGEPITFNGKLIGELNKNIGVGYNRFLLGVESVVNGNIGDGKYFVDNMSAGEHYRSRSFKEIPFLSYHSAFIEDNIVLEVGSQRLELMGGVRATKLIAENYDYNIQYEPRLNGRFTLFELGDKVPFSSLSLRGGWGLQYKMPTLLHLYPDASYEDLLSFTYIDAENSYDIALMTTYKHEGQNRDLKIAKNKKMELGADFTLFNRSISLTYFKERLTNGYNFARQATPISYRQYDALEEVGLRPEFIDGDLVLDDKILEYNVVDKFSTYMRADNGIEQDKWGVEYNIDLGKCRYLATSVKLDGAYMHIKQVANHIEAYYPNQIIGGVHYPYVGLYAGGDKTTNGQIRQRFNTNIRLVTHIPRLKLIFTSMLQCVWIDKMQRISEFSGESLNYGTNEKGERVDNDIAINQTVNPIAYMDLQGNISPFTEVEENDPAFDLLKKKSSSNFFREDSFDPYFMINLRLSKELGDIAMLSFFANNLFNHCPQRFSDSSKSYVRVNTPLSFGADLSIKF